MPSQKGARARAKSAKTTNPAPELDLNGSEWRRPKGVRIRPIPIRSLFPNVLTLIALCAGLTSIRFALQARWETAVIFIAVAAVFDALDGRMARLLKGTSKFGAELDSLSDVISFGVAPALVMYLWALRDLKGAGWVLALAFCACCALRLARFNTAEENPAAPSWTKTYFVGLPAPGAAGLALMPLVIDLHFETDALRIPLLCGIVFAIVSYLMVSQVPTISAKRIAIRKEYALQILVIVALLTALLATFPWLVLSVIGLLYAVSIPYGAWRYRKLAKAHEAEVERAAASAPGEGAGESRDRDVREEDPEPRSPQGRSILH